MWEGERESLRHGHRTERERERGGGRCIQGLLKEEEGCSAKKTGGESLFRKDIPPPWEVHGVVLPINAR